MRPDLSPLLRHSGLQSAAVVRRRASGIATGNPRLDALLYWQGWPQGNLTELLTQPGLGEVSLVAPALMHLAAAGGWTFLIDPPHLPHAQALGQLGLPGDRLLVLRCLSHGDSLWAAEQILRAGICAALLLWERKNAWRHARLLRLQNLARNVGGTMFLYRRPQALREPSPAPLRIALTGTAGAVRLTIHKQLGGSGQHLMVGREPLTAPAPPCPLPAPLAPRQPLAGGQHWQRRPDRLDNRIQAVH